MRAFLLAAAALSAALSYGDRVERAALNDIPPDQPSVVTNVDLSGIVTNVDGKVDKKRFRWPGTTNSVDGAEWAEKAKSAESASLATRALSADSLESEGLKGLDRLFGNVETGKVTVAYATNSFRKAVVRYALPHDPAKAASVRDGWAADMTQGQKTELLRRIVEYLKSVEGLED